MAHPVGYIKISTLSEDAFIARSDTSVLSLDFLCLTRVFFDLTASSLSQVHELAEKCAYLLARVANGRVSVKANSLENRRIILELMKELNIGHFSFTPKGEKPFKAVLWPWGLDGYNDEEVLSELLQCEELAIKPTAVRRMKRFCNIEKRKVELPLYTVSFPPATQLIELKGLSSLFHLRAGFLLLRSSTSPLQCYRCQEYGHVMANCSMPVRCVKCSLSHMSADCPSITTESERTTLKCCLCGEFGHPASFRGCPKASVGPTERAEEEGGRSSSRTNCAIKFGDNDSNKEEGERTDSCERGAAAEGCMEKGTAHEWR